MAIYKRDIVDVEMESGSIYRSMLCHTIGEGDANAQRFGVRVLRNGEPVNLGGSNCTGDVIRPTGDTVVIEGVVSDDLAYVILPQACYTYEGQFSLAIKISGGTVVDTLRIVDGVVANTTTETLVDPGTIIPSIEDLIQAIEDAVASIPADYSDLWKTIAPVFSTGTDYVVGQYVTYSGKMYRFTTAHPAGDWNSSHVTAVNVGGELKRNRDAFDALGLYVSNGYVCQRLANE